MVTRDDFSASDSAYKAGAAALLIAIATIVVAHGFELVGGYRPCPLCLMQRWAYYAAIPVLFLALVLTTAGQRRLAALAFVAVALAFLGNAGLGIYHAGVEWAFWPGPDTCAGAPQSLASGPGALLSSLETANVVRCDRAPWQFLGLSFAGWNVVLSGIGFAATLKASIASLAR